MIKLWLSQLNLSPGGEAQFLIFVLSYICVLLQIPIIKPNFPSVLLHIDCQKEYKTFQNVKSISWRGEKQCIDVNEAIMSDRNKFNNANGILKKGP